VLSLATTSPDDATTKPAAAAPEVSTLALPAPGQLIRVAGLLDVAITRAGEGESTTFSFDGVNTIDTPLPVGYPDPTPPGAIDLKHYPSVRRAEVSGEVKRGGDGSDQGFWPLFKHIQRRDIAMTSPVEMEYHDPAKPAETAAPAEQPKPAEEPAKAKPPEQWTMAFLYRRAEQGATGTDDADKRVKIVDLPAQLVVSIGMKGNYSRELVANGEQEVAQWLAGQSRFERSGDARVLYYHGPSLRPWRKWAEVQIPVRERIAPEAKTPVP
jgi:hypothetical protein